MRILLLLLSCNLAWPLFSAEPAAPSGSPEAARAENSDSWTNVFHPVRPRPEDGKIAYTTAWLLEHSQFLHKTFNTKVSTNFFGRYLETYDPQHLHFVQSDLAEFDHYRTNLHRLFLALRPNANTAPADEIFNRFMERLEQHVACVDDLLDHEQFTFDTNERVVINRKDQPYPKTLDEAKQLWRDVLRFEYLQEKLVKAGAKKKEKGPHAAAKPAPPKEVLNPPAEAPGSSPGDTDAKLAAKPKTEHEEIVEILHRRYHRRMRAFAELNDEDVLGIYLTTLAHVYDPHSDYMTHSQLVTFSIQMNLKLEGIGAELRSEDGYCIVYKILPGGPARRATRPRTRSRKATASWRSPRAIHPRWN